MSARRLDLETPSLDMSGAIHDLTSLSAIAVSVMENTIRDMPESFKSDSLKVPNSYIVVVLTEEQFQTVHFINAHIKGIADTALRGLEAVEGLIMERAR